MGSTSRSAGLAHEVIRPSCQPVGRCVVTSPAMAGQNFASRLQRAVLIRARSSGGLLASDLRLSVYMLLKTASKNYIPSPERKSASSCGLQLPAARTTGRCLQGLDFISIFFQECLCKFWAGIIKIWMRYKPDFSKKICFLFWKIFFSTAAQFWIFIIYMHIIFTYNFCQIKILKEFFQHNFRINKIKFLSITFSKQLQRKYF